MALSISAKFPSHDSSFLKCIVCGISSDSRAQWHGRHDSDGIPNHTCGTCYRYAEINNGAQRPAEPITLDRARNQYLKPTDVNPAAFIVPRPDYQDV